MACHECIGELARRFLLSIPANGIAAEKDKVTEREIVFKLLSSQMICFLSVYFWKYFDRYIYEEKPRFLGGMEKHAQCFIYLSRLVTPSTTNP